MAVVETVAILLALTALALLPCLVVLVIFADAFANVVRRQRRRIYRAGPPAPRSMVQSARASSAPGSTAVAPVPPAPGEIEPLDPAGPPLEQIAAEIHRLTSARRSAAAGTARFIAATRAYDRRLGHACRALEIEERLSDLTGLDLELERLRVEDDLVNAGFVLDTDISRSA